MNAEVPDLTPPTKAKTSNKVTTPKADGAPKEPKEPKVTRFKTLYPDEAKFVKLVEGNPKRGKSRERFEGYTGATTIGEALKQGVTRADVAWDVGHGLIKIVE